MNGMLKRKKRNMAALTPKFKIKCGLEQGEFVRVAYAIEESHRNICIFTLTEIYVYTHSHIFTYTWTDFLHTQRSNMIFQHCQNFSIEASFNLHI